MLRLLMIVEEKVFKTFAALVLILMLPFFSVKAAFSSDEFSSEKKA